MSEITTTYTAKDFASGQEIRWCPGCGDYSILAQVQRIMPMIGKKKEDIVFVSGIGCSSRFPYYMDTYGMHSIHGRAPAIASGLKITQPNLSVWVVTGDGDGLSIGTNHLMHLLRRNIDVNVLLFNNQIYGLTKGQYSPTSEEHKVTKSSPYGSIDKPFNPLALVLGANATFVARSMDRDPKHLQDMLLLSEKHRGTSFLEIYQNCNIFNDGAFEEFTDKKVKDANVIYLEEGQPLIFGADRELGIVMDGYTPKMVKLSEVSADDLWIHDSHDLLKAQILVRFFEQETEHFGLPRPFGVIYQKDRMPYDEAANLQLTEIHASRGKGNLNALLKGNNTWEIVA